MAGAKQIQDDSADLKYAVEATKKALEDIESRRRQRSPMPMRREKREDGGDEEEEDEMDEEELEAEMDSKGRGDTVTYYHIQ